MPCALSLAGLVQSVAAENTVAIPSFVEETASAGIDSVYAGEWEYMVGGGVATFDCNADGFADMLLAGGTSPAKFYRNTSTQGGALHFEMQSSGLELDKVTGAYPMDVDSDGNTDLVLLRVGENVVMRGLGNCRFERPMKPGALMAAMPGRRPLPPPGKTARSGRRWPSAIISTAAMRLRHGGLARTTGSTVPPWRRETHSSRHPWR